jgi:hypothetical protein
MKSKDIQIIGNKFKVDFGEYVFELNFETETQMTYEPLGSDALGKAEMVEITRTQIRTNVFMVYWKEKSNTTVTHIQDFENELVYTNITTPDNSFLNMKGTLTPIID